MQEGTFKDWLADALERHGVSRRELARRLAEQAPVGDEDSYRSSVRRILNGNRVPTQPTRDSIQRALDDWTAPGVDDEDEPISRELVAVKLDEMIARQRHDLRNLLRFRQALTNGGI